MKLFLKRKFKGDKYTIGDLYIDEVLFCNTIEDKVRNLPAFCPNTPKWVKCNCKEKVYGETAIPAGTYNVILEVSSKFKKVLPQIQNVPHFLGVLIHSGNTEKESAGCINVGKNTIKGKVLESKVTLTALMEKLEQADSITITIE